MITIEKHKFLSRLNEWLIKSELGGNALETQNAKIVIEKAKKIPAKDFQNFFYLLAKNEYQKYRHIYDFYNGRCAKIKMDKCF